MFFATQRVAMVFQAAAAAAAVGTPAAVAAGGPAVKVKEEDTSSQWRHGGVFASLCRLDILSRFVNNKKVDDPFRVVHQKV